MVITKLDEIAWLYNIRGADIPCNPVAICYAVVTLNEAHLFINPIKLGSHESECKKHLIAGGIQLHSYKDIDNYLLKLCNNIKLNKKNEKILIDITQINWKLYKILNDSNEDIIKNQPSLISLPKAIKNPVEIEGMRQAHIRDGVALTAFFCWLETYYCNLGTHYIRTFMCNIYSIQYLYLYIILHIHYLYIQYIHTIYTIYTHYIYTPYTHTIYTHYI